MGRKYISKLNISVLSEYLKITASQPNHDNRRGLLNRLYSYANDNDVLTYQNIRDYLTVFNDRELSQQTLTIYANITLDYLLWLGDKRLILWFYEIVDLFNWQVTTSKKYRDNRP